MSITFIDKDGKKIEYFLEPLGVREDGSSKTWQAFAEGSITEITAKDLKGLTKIRDGLFTNCDKLATVSIPTNITEIGDNVFKNCDSLTDVLYEGTKEEWESIVIGSDNEVVTDSSYIYSETEPTKPGNYWHYDENGEKVVWEPFYSKGLAYTLNSDNASYTVSGIGTATDTDIVIPDTYEGLPVTAIGDKAFQSNANITSVEIPEGVTSIGGWAFSGASALSSISIPSTITRINDSAFMRITTHLDVYIVDLTKWCNIQFVGFDANPMTTSYGGSRTLYVNKNPITELVIPESVTTINSYTFYNITQLTSIVIHDKVTFVGQQAFAQCSYVTNLVIGSGLQTVQSAGFSRLYRLKNLNLPDSLSTAYNRAFADCSSVEYIRVSPSLSNINYEVFANCPKCLTYDFSSYTSVPTLADKTAFRGINANAKIIVPNNLYNEWITATNWSDYASYITQPPTKGLAYTLNSDNASYSVSGIGTATDTDIVIPDTYEGLPVTAVGVEAFLSNKNITSVIIPDSVTTIDSKAFQYCSNLTSVEIPNSVTFININVFNSCTKLEKIVIPNSIASIPFGMFDGCERLMSVIIPDSVTTIDSKAFYYCKSLPEIKIPSSVASIGSSAFGYCDSCLKYDFSSHTSVPTLASKYGFSGINANAKIIVPDALYDQWIAATNWSDYASYIVKASEYVA